MSDGPPPTSAYRHSGSTDRLRRSVLEGSGRTAPALRTAVATRAALLWSGRESEVDLPDSLGGYIDRVMLGPYKVMDEDVERLRGAGYSEDEIFELSVAAAVGCGLEALRVGLAAIDAGSG